MDFGFISTPFFCIVLDLSAPLILVIFDNLPFENAFLASPRVSNLARFQHVLWTSFRVLFFIRFRDIFEAIWAPFGTIFSEKTVPKIA